MNWYKQATKSDKKEPSFSAILKENDGFYYLDIPQPFITGLHKMLPDDVDETPYKQKGYGGIGAHVSVIHEDEFGERGVEVEEVGQSFDFEIVGAKQTNPDGWDEMKQVYFVEIESPQICDMRKKYGLPKTYQGKGHNFHITFALEKK